MTEGQRSLRGNIAKQYMLIHHNTAIKGSGNNNIHLGHPKTAMKTQHDRATRDVRRDYFKAMEFIIAGTKQ
jgi:hypothetical protein